MLHRYAAVVSLVALTACPETEPFCEAGYRLEGDRCVAVDGGADGGEIADAAPGDGRVETDGGPCGTCGGATPMCRVSDGMCVACLENTHCSGVTPICNATGACEACGDDADCMTIAATPVCDETDGSCVECTPDSEATACGSESCDPATLACSGIERDSRLTCQACVSDSDCMGADDRCVPMTYMGGERGGYCLRLVSATCARPYGTVITAISLSGEPETMYCGVDQDTVSCEAVRALIDDIECAGGDAMECMADGARCETVGAFVNRCTYTCGTAGQCPSGVTCAAGYCGS